MVHVVSCQLFLYGVAELNQLLCIGVHTCQPSLVPRSEGGRKKGNSPSLRPGMRLMSTINYGEHNTNEFRDFLLPITTSYAESLASMITKMCKF